MTDTAKIATEGEDASIAVTVDGRAFAARPGELIIEAAERAGVFVPRFCYHPRMEPVGMCRMCLVEVSGPRGFSLQPACYLRVSDGMEIRTSSETARKAQEGVLEFLLVNHPLDCPVCDKGGECPLQDQALAYGPGESRFLEEKRHWAKPIEIGPLVALDRERCIQCARCTRFADEIAGDALIDFAFRGDQIEVATFPAEPFTSYFSGNTVQICPVGALTAVPYRFRARPWDLEQVETTCTACAVGCRTVAQSSAGKLVRFLGVDAEPVNQSWLCDKGRFSYETLYSPQRLTTPELRRDGTLAPVRWHEALSLTATRLRDAAAEDPSKIGVIGGAHFTNEDAYAWAKLAKSVLRTDSVDAQVGDGLPAEVILGLPRATIDEAATARLVILLAGDLREELPVLFLRLRHGAVHDGVPVIECAPVATAMSPHAIHLSYLPGDAASLVAALLGGSSAHDLTGVDPDRLSAARDAIASARAAGSESGEGVVVVLGRPSLADSPATLTSAAGALHDALPGAKFLSALRRANVHGALEMGLAPGLLPGRVDLDAARAWFEQAWGAVPAAPGADAFGILRAAAAGELSALVLLGADPLSDFPDQTLARAALEAAPFVVAIGTHRDASMAFADVVLPTSADGEHSGTTTNIEGRVTRVAQKVVAPGVAWSPWVIATELAARLGADLGVDNVESLSEEIGRTVPSYAGLSLQALVREVKLDGVILPVAPGARTTAASPARLDPIATPGIASVNEQGAALRVGTAVPLGGEAESEPVVGASQLPAPIALGGGAERVVAHRLDTYSYRLVVRRRLYDPGTLVTTSASLSALAPPVALAVHPAELARLGVSSGDRVRLRSARGELVVEVVADEHLARRVVVIGAHGVGPDAPSALGLVDATELATDVRLETI